MKRIVTSILGVSLLAGAVFAAGNQQMSNMDGMHSKMNKEECFKMHKNMHSIKKEDQKNIASSKSVFDSFYPSSLDGGEIPYRD